MDKENNQTNTEASQNLGHWYNVSGKKIDIEKYVGFVYQITELSTKKSYIGIKKFKKRIRRKPLKGQKRVRIDYVESDWKKYHTSSAHLKDRLKENPDDFDRTIIDLCESVTDMKAKEAYYQLEYYIKGDWNQLWNEMINLRLRIPKNEL